MDEAVPGVPGAVEMRSNAPRVRIFNSPLMNLFYHESKKFKFQFHEIIEITSSHLSNLSTHAS